MKIREPASAIKLKPSNKLDGKIRRVYAVFRRIVELYLTVELLRGLDTHSRLHAARRAHDAFCGHDAVTTARSRCGGDAVTALLWPQRDHARQPRRGHDGCDAVTTRRRRGHDAFCTTRSRQGHDRITTRSRCSHDRVTTGSRRGHDAFCGHDTVTVTTRSRCSHDAFCGHDVVTTWPRQGHDAVTTRFVVTTRSRQGHDRVATRSRRGQVKPRARRASCEHGFSDFIHEESARKIMLTSRTQS